MGVGYATSRAAQSEGTMSSEHLLTSESFKNVFSEALLGVRRKETRDTCNSNSNPLISLVLLSHREFVSDTRLVESAAGWSRQISLKRMGKIRIKRYQRAILPGAVVAMVLISAGRLSSVSLNSCHIGLTSVYVSESAFLIMFRCFILAASKRFPTSFCPISPTIRSCYTSQPKNPPFSKFSGWTKSTQYQPWRWGM